MRTLILWNLMVFEADAAIAVQVTSDHLNIALVGHRTQLAACI